MNALAANAKHDFWLTLTWLATVVFGPLLLLVFLAGVPLSFEHLATVCPGICEDNRLMAEAANQWQKSGATMEQYSALVTVLAILLALVCFGVAIFLLVRQPRDRIAVFVALMFIFLGTTFGIGDELVGERVPRLAGLLYLLNQGGFGLFPILFMSFPDGRFVPSWSKWLPLVFLFIVLVPLPANLATSDPIFLMLIPVWALAGPLSQIYRYRRSSNPVQKQQIKWMAAGFGLGMGGFTVTTILGIFLEAPGTTNPLLVAAILTASYLSISIIPVTIGIGVLRYRLWDVDVVIRKTLIYALLTTMLAVVYFGMVVLLQSVIGWATDEQSPLVIIFSTLLIAALFSPLRRRIQSFIDLRFYRRKYDAALTLAQFAQTARDEVDMERLSATLINVVEKALQPEQTSLWLKKNKGSK